MVEDNFITILLTENLGPIYRADPGLLAYTHTHTAMWEAIVSQNS